MHNDDTVHNLRHFGPQNQSFNIKHTENGALTEAQEERRNESWDTWGIMYQRQLHPLAPRTPTHQTLLTSAAVLFEASDTRVGQSPLVWNEK